MVQFEILGKPIAKGRPRVTRNHTYTPQRTVDYENLVRYSYLEKYLGADVLTGPLAMELIFIFIKPKSSKNHYPVARPDTDNLIKSVTDGLNKLAYKDDSQIIQINARKEYGNTDRTIVRIMGIGKE